MREQQNNVLDYEDEFKRFSGSRYVFSFYSGRSALYAILKALKIGRGDEVVIQGFTCIAVPAPVLLSGAKPVYADIHSPTLNLSRNTVEAVVTPKTKAVVFQHTFGMPEGIEEVAEFCNSRGIFLIEDCSQAIGINYKGRLAGQWGRAAFFSSHWMKTYSTGVGGMLITNDKSLAESVELQLSEHVKAPFIKRRLLDIQIRLFDKFFSPSIFNSAYKIQKMLVSLGLTPKTMDIPPDGFNIDGVPKEYYYRLSDFQAKTGIGKLARIAENLEIRLGWFKFFKEKLSNMGLSLHGRFHELSLPYLQIPIASDNKRQLIEEARRNGVLIMDWPASTIHPLELEETYLAGYKTGSCPNAEKLFASVISLPTDTKTTMESAEKLLAFLENRKISPPSALA